MNALVIYDSLFGNTKQVAETVGRTLGRGTPVVAVSDVTPERLQGVELLVVGSPINAWRPSQRMGAFLAGLASGQLAGVKVAAFDTRVNLFIHGDAVRKIAKLLEAAGATVIAEPHWFFVKGKEGPLADGELARAEGWARTLLEHAA